MINDDVQFDRFDVNRDGGVSAVDALQVINQLARSSKLLQTSPVGEAESEMVERSIRKVVDAAAVNTGWQTDSIDDDLLRLLADDQARTEIGKKP